MKKALLVNKRQLDYCRFLDAYGNHLGVEYVYDYVLVSKIVDISDDTREFHHARLLELLSIKDK